MRAFRNKRSVSVSPGHMMKYFGSIFIPLIVATAGFGQSAFLRNADARLRPRSVSEVCPTSDQLTQRLLIEYGAIFVSTSNVKLPFRCILESEDEVQAFQAASNSRYATIGKVTVTLQEPALRALLAASEAAAKAGVPFSPNGGAVASTRDYATTVRLWRSRFEPNLNYWTGAGRIKRSDADAARAMPIRQQIARVLAWEDDNIWFSTGRDKSILYSVAAPGASQHNFGLAIDVAQHSNARVRSILADHGWFQTVKSDLPHFTYLGRKRDELAALGLKLEKLGEREFWIPDLQ